VLASLGAEFVCFIFNLVMLVVEFLIARKNRSKNGTQVKESYIVYK
jgi:hypothetical protein